MSYIYSQIQRSDKLASRQQGELLSKAGLTTGQPADFALGIYDHEYHLIATGSLHDNELHSIAVDCCHQGEGMLNQIVTHLYEHRFQSGHSDLCVTVKEDLAPLFKSLGFHEIKRICEDTVFMGNRQAVNLIQG